LMLEVARVRVADDVKPMRAGGTVTGRSRVAVIPS